MLVDSASPIAPALLAWYDANHRSLPWRSPPGSPPPDPYAVWLSEIMLQQTTVAAVRPRFAAFLARWSTIDALAAPDEAEVMRQWAGLGYYARARNLIACARAVAARGGFPEDEASLRALPGIGAYTAAAIAAIAFGQRAVAVDANVERVVARLFAVETALPAARPALRALADLIVPQARAGDFAQAMMDLGSSLCSPRAPACMACPLAAFCQARASGAPASFPRKPARAAKPTRYGSIFWLEHEGEVLLERRPAKGLLGGMRALPTGPWVDAPPGLADAPAGAAWHLAGHGRHVFTHFALNYAVYTAIGEAADGAWWPVDRLEDAGLPTLFANAVARALAARASISQTAPSS